MTRITLWADDSKIAQLTDTQLDRLGELGFSGFVHMGGRLIGGPLTLLDAGRFRARGFKNYLGTKLANDSNLRTPLVEWFDGADWRDVALPKFRALAEAARNGGYEGIAFDQELLGKAIVGTWAWKYSGVGFTEAEVRAEVASRGIDSINAMISAFPDLELAIYHFDYSGSWREQVQWHNNSKALPSSRYVFTDWMRGLATGGQPIRVFNDTFYKDARFDGATWDDAMQHDSRAFWALNHPEHVTTTPFIWLTEGTKTRQWRAKGSVGPIPFDHERSPEHINEQIRAAGANAIEEFCIYDQLMPDPAFYGRFEAALKAATAPKPDPIDPTPYSEADLKEAREVSQAAGFQLGHEEGYVLGFNEARSQLIEAATNLQPGETT